MEQVKIGDAAVPRRPGDRGEAGREAVEHRDGLRHVPPVRRPTPIRREFPKWQEQMSKFATLRDMINWCIEKPNQGEMIDPDGQAMKALEAYITWSNRNSPLSPGTH